MGNNLLQVERRCALQEFIKVIDALGVDDQRGTYELDQNLGVASEYAQSLKSVMLDAIDGLESAHKTLTDGPS